MKRTLLVHQVSGLGFPHIGALKRGAKSRKLFRVQEHKAVWEDFVGTAYLGFATSYCYSERLEMEFWA